MPLPLPRMCRGNGFIAKLVGLEVKLRTSECIDENIDKRKAIARKYREGLRNIPGIRVLDDLPGVKHNYAYFPILIDEDVYGKTRDDLYEELKRQNIHGRRYFYPLISSFPTYRGLDSADPTNLPVASRVAEQILCLPIFPGLEFDVQKRIIEICMEMCQHDGTIALESPAAIGNVPPSHVKSGESGI